MKKTLFITLAIIFVIIGAAYYWYAVLMNPGIPKQTPIATSPVSGFSPFNNSNNNSVSTSTQGTNQGTTTEPTAGEGTDIVGYREPKLRQLSTAPVAGMGIASSTKDTTTVRYIDRGTGYVYEADNTSNEVVKISNTTIPRIYESYANKGARSFVLRYLKDQTDIISNFYVELRPTGTSTSQTPFELKGKFLSNDISSLAVSPAGDKVFTWNIESGQGVGYVSSFDEKSKVKVATSPLTQLTLDWPETNTVVLNTKSSGVATGYIYTIDTKTGLMKSVVGGVRGLTGKVSRDLSRVIYSASTNNSFSTYILNIKDNKTEGVIFKTLADKCVWSNVRKNEVYCAVPTEIPANLYPDDWYKGSVSFTDQIWHLDAITGEVHLMGDLFRESDQLIDATNLVLDTDDNHIYFTNKKDLTLWVLDLNQ